MSLVGGIFILTSAVMYFVFIMAMILVGSFFFSRHGAFILRILGVGVLLAGAINLKDFFFFKKGVSLSLDEKQQKTIYKKARKVIKNVTKADSIPQLIVALLGTVALAIFVNLVELGCTAILPGVYMGSLLQKFGDSIGLPHLFYTAFYAIIYVLPLIAILGNFIYTFNSTRMKKEHGQILKLVGGILMLLFGLAMILKPGLLQFG